MSWADKYPEQRLVPFDHGWSAAYRHHEAHLRRQLGASWQLEHVGSTSVPGLLAKPVIDIAIGVPAGTDPAEAGLRLRRAGWSDLAEVGDHWTTAFPRTGVRTVIGHVFTSAQWPHAHVRLFADWLRRHDSDRDRYAALKADLVARDVWSSDYTRAKGPFVLGIVNRARAELGLPPESGPL